MMLQLAHHRAFQRKKKKWADRGCTLAIQKLMVERSCDTLLAFYHLIYQLKRTRRTGWLKRSIIENVESISDHMYRMAMIAMTLPLDNPAISRERCIMMALVHDLAEAVVGDITPECGITEEEKHRLEAEAMSEITKNLTPATASLLSGLWEEYEGAVTEEAKLVKQIDKFEFALQAAEYQKERGVDLTEFVQVVRPKLSDPHLVALWEDIQKEL